jgi:hypothetical protein
MLPVERIHRSLPLPDEVLKGQVRDHRHPGDVHEKERHLESFGDPSFARYGELEHSGGKQERPVPGEPGQGPAGSHECEGSQRRGECPDGHGAGGPKSAKGPLQGKRQQQHEEELAEPKEPVPLGPGEPQEACQGQQLIGQGDRRREPQAEEAVRHHPDRGQRHDQHGEQRERRLPQAILVGVGGKRAETGQTIQQPVQHPRAHDRG